MRKLISTFPLLFLLLFVQCRQAPVIPTGLVSEKAMVVAAREEASKIGVDIMQQGGNAFDAMVATELALAVAYQVHCRLSEEAPVRDHGFDHTTQGSYAVAAGVSKCLGLNEEQTANAIAISGTAFNALRVTRTGALSNWKGIAYPNTAFSATHAAFLAENGISGPQEVFEGNKGFKHSIAGDFSIDWQRENLEKVNETILKKYNAEIHSQSALEAMEEIRNQHSLEAERVSSIELDTFDVAFNIIGGGEEGEKTTIRTKEEADHSLPYMLAAMLLDGEVTPKQYVSSRINSEELQSLLKLVRIREQKEFSDAFPEEMKIRLLVTTKDGLSVSRDKKDYEGFSTRPMSWEHVAEKYHLLAAENANSNLRTRIHDVVAEIDSHSVDRLTNLLGQVKSAA